MSKMEITTWLIAVTVAFVGWFVWNTNRQYKRAKILNKLEKLEWRNVSTFESNWCGCLKIFTEAREDGWMMLSAEELIDAMWYYPSKFRKMNYWTSEGLTVSFPERKILKENPVQSAGLYLVRVRRKEVEKV